MSKNKKNIIILVFLCILLVLIGISVYIDLNDDNFISYDVNEILLDNNLDNINDNNVVNDSGNNNITNDIDNETDSNNIANNMDNGNIKNYNEEDVVSYFENIQYEVEKSESFKEKFKDYFVTIVDFIFYDTEINGYTFDSLTDIAKVRIIAIALKLDSKIEEYIPEYKENISNTTGRVYEDIKEKLVTSYMNISSFICEDNENECDKTKDIFNDVKNYCKIGWDFIKSLFKNGVGKIKDWYEVYSGK